MLVSKEGNLVTLINVFETTPEQQQALLGKTWETNWIADFVRSD